MAKEISTAEDLFDISIEWPKTPASGGDKLLDASVGRITIKVAGALATAYRSDKGDTGESIELPLYDFAEWIAQNWWALLYEPKKSDDAEADLDFRSRHWLGIARKGFPLPSLWFLPAGNRIEIDYQESYLKFSRLTFVNAASALVPTDHVADTLTSFIEDVLRRVDEAGIADTIAHRLWAAVRNTKPEERFYCRLIGSLGLSPYQENPGIADLLESQANIPEEILFDVCQASRPLNLPTVIAASRTIFDGLSKTKPSNLAPLSEIEIPPDASTLAWRWGVEASKRVQQHFGISPQDPMGAQNFFDKIDLGYDPVSGISDSDEVSAALSRNEIEMHVAVTDSPEPQRRFSAARAAFLGWITRSHSSRMVTGARTRDQQASRAFAAQLLAPIEYIRARSTNKLLSSSRVFEIAQQLRVSAAVVRNQAENNQIRVVA
jgi:hypothetical protein